MGTLVVRLTSLVLWLAAGLLARAAELHVVVCPQFTPVVYGEPVLLRCEFTNQADYALSFDLGDREVAGVRFILEPRSSHPTTLPYQVHRGGGSFSAGTNTLAPGKTVVRYVVLDQFFRAPAPGEYQLAYVVRQGTGELQTDFVLSVAAADAGLELRHATGALEDKAKRLEEEWASYHFALETYLSYVADRAPEIFAELVRDQSDPDKLRLLRQARDMGPGGCRILD